MELKPICFGFWKAHQKESKTCVARRTLLMIAVAFSMTAGAQSITAKITLSLQNAPLEEAFQEIKKQSGYNFVYTREQIRKAGPTTLHLQDAPLEEAIRRCLHNQPFTYVIEGNYIALKDKIIPPPQINQLDLSGTVRDETGKPLSAATVQVKITGKITSTDSKGQFLLSGVDENAILLVSSVGYHTQEIAVEGKSHLEIKLSLSITALDETVVIAYGTTTQRLNTGSVGRVTAREIANQPVSNPLATLQGRVPGVLVTQGSGNAGASFSIQIRGQSSVGGYANAPYPVGNEPLYVIDGIPYSPGTKLNQLLNASTTPGDARSGGLSPLNLIDPADIESIEILKDADATAIYGSRGANGVVLITTKRGKAGKSKLDLSFYSGISRPTRMVKYLSTPDYLTMRKEAFLNDGVSPNTTNAPDLLLFDSMAYTDFAELFYGNPGRNSDIQLSYSGGSAQTQFLLSGGYHLEQSMLPGNFQNKRPNVNLNLNHQSTDGRFRLGLSSNYSFNDNDLSNRDLTQFISSLPPNNPALVDGDDKLTWSSGGVSYLNPLAYTRQKYQSTVDNLITNLSLSYEPVRYLQLRANLGYTTTIVDETSTVPKVAQDPQYNPSGVAEFSSRKAKSWLLEPLAEYKRPVGKGRIDLMVGGTLQQITSRGSYLVGTNYSSDALLHSINNAGSVLASNTHSQYRYLGAFAKVNYNWKEKYLFNLTGRRDGSSRFGSGKQFSNFGAVGLAWIFSREKVLQRNLTFLSFGKLRLSYGTSGNDQIGDYIYMDTWSPTTNNYGGTPGIRPTGLYNPDFAWELNRKAEAALDLGFVKDRILFSVAYYHNRSSNQLISYRLPTQTGFSSLRARNFPAVVQNTGLELALSAHVLKRRNLAWTLALNATFPKNKLVAFPGLATSSYANIYVVGQSLSVVRGYRYLGVDPQTGVYQFEDLNKDNSLTTADYQVLGNLVPEYYGGLSSSLKFHSLTMDLLLEYRKQHGRSIAYFQADAYPGLPYNQPYAVLDRWQKPGDVASVQRFTTTPGSAAYVAALRYITSDGTLTNASFVRLRNLALSYALPPNLLSKMKVQAATVFMNAQNWLTFTSFLGDPETQNYKVLPPLKTMVVGFRFTF